MWIILLLYPVFPTEGFYEITVVDTAIKGKTLQVTLEKREERFIEDTRVVVLKDVDQHKHGNGASVIGVELLASLNHWLTVDGHFRLRYIFLEFLELVQAPHFKEGSGLWLLDVELIDYRQGDAMFKNPRPHFFYNKLNRNSVCIVS